MYACECLSVAVCVLLWDVSMSFVDADANRCFIYVLGTKPSAMEVTQMAIDIQGDGFWVWDDCYMG